MRQRQPSPQAGELTSSKTTDWQPDHPKRVTTDHQFAWQGRLQMPTTEIIDEIRARLERHPRVPHPAEVAVSEREGAVTLRGSVGSIPQRAEVVRVARSVPGVRTVDDQLRVDLRDSWLDDELRGVTLQALVGDADVPEDRIDVGVTDGWLTLKGEVQHQYESNAAFDAASRIPGIGGITNEIKVITAGIDG